MSRTQLVFLASLALAASLAAGCIITTDGDNVVNDGVFRTTWSLSTSAGATTCQTQGADKVSFLFTAHYDGMGFDELFDCFDFAGSTNPLPLDDYTYVATLLD